MQVAGKLVVINATQVVSDKFSKRTFVVETNDKFPQEIELQLTQDKCDLIDAYNLGDSINASYNLRGKKWIDAQGNPKWFNSLEAWKIEKLGSATQPQATPSKTPANEEEDDLGLPF